MNLMNDIFRPLLDNCVLVYLDDILIFSKSEKEHQEHLLKVLEILRKEKLYAKLSKCEFFKHQVDFLGHVVSDEGIKVDDTKTEVIRNWPVPKNLTEMRSFLGLANFYQRYVKNCAKIAVPLTELEKKNVTFSWNQEQQNAFDQLKNALCSTPILQIPEP